MRSTTPVELLGPLNPIEKRFAPPTLWVEGDVGLLRRSPRVAVVGTRNPTPDGSRRTKQLVKGLVAHGATIVSGLAAGVDTIAHTQAIDAGGKTIAILGTPLDQVFPKANAHLQRQLAHDHLIVSEFAPASRVSRGNFPRRNRTMALVSDASVITEAGETSGTVSQGWEALRLGRPLFLLRSLVDSAITWPQEMVDHGAFVLTRIDDLLAVLPDDAVDEVVSF